MVRGGQLVNEALNMLSSFADTIENKILSRSASLKPQVISISQKFIDVSNMFFKIFELVSRFASDIVPGSTAMPSKWWSISIYNDRIVIVRHKPVFTSIAYIRSDEKIVFKTKYVTLDVQRGFVKLQKRGLKIEFDPSDPEDIVGKLSEIKYILREIARHLDLLLYDAVKKFSK